jgi:predicted transcriptional regulator
MYVANDQSFARAAGSWTNDYPPEVQRLFRREHEIATIIYDAGLATAKDVAARMAIPLSNAAIRSMLNRLVRKGVLTRQEYGPRHAFVYGPAVTASSTRQAALEQFAEDFYDDSLSALADAIANLLVVERAPVGRVSSPRRRGRQIQSRQAPMVGANHTLASQQSCSY